MLKFNVTNSNAINHHMIQVCNLFLSFTNTTHTDIAYTLHEKYTKYTGITRRSPTTNHTVFTNTPDNNDYWMRIITRFNDSDARASLFRFARRSMKIPTGTEAVENMFNQIKLNHTAKRGGLGKRKLRRMIYCIGKHLLSSKWW